MNRLISENEDCVSRANLISKLEILERRYGSDFYWETRKIVDKLPSVKPQEKTGHWIEQIDHEENCRTLICSNCDRPALHDEDSIWKHKFCPHCGARMVEPQESEEVIKCTKTQ